MNTAQLQAAVATQVRRLDYAMLQLTREAKFKRREKPEDRRFFRAHDVVLEVHQTLAALPKASQDAHCPSGAPVTTTPHRLEVEISAGYPHGLRGDITFKLRPSTPIRA